LRRIVFKQCDRLTRRRPTQVSLDAIAEPKDINDDPAAAVERLEIAQQVHRAIADSPEAQRQVIILFYMQQHA